MKKGKVQTISSISWQQAARGFDNKGKATQDIGFTKTESAMFAEYGLTDKWTLVVRPSVQSVSLENNGNRDAAKGFGASELSMRRLVRQKGSMVVSMQAGVFIPGQVENGFNEALGQGGLDWEVRALAGRSFTVKGKNIFTDVQLAYRSRTGRADDEVRASATVGYYPKQNFMILGEMFTVHALPSTKDTVHTIANLKVQFGAVWFFSSGQNGIQIAGAKTLYGRNVIDDKGLTLSWWRRF